MLYQEEKDLCFLAVCIAKLLAKLFILILVFTPWDLGPFGSRSYGLDVRLTLCDDFDLCEVLSRARAILVY